MIARYYPTNEILYGTPEQNGFITEAGDVIPMDKVEILPEEE